MFWFFWSIFLLINPRQLPRNFHSNSPCYCCFGSKLLSRSFRRCSGNPTRSLLPCCWCSSSWKFRLKLCCRWYFRFRWIPAGLSSSEFLRCGKTLLPFRPASCIRWDCGNGCVLMRWCDHRPIATHEIREQREPRRLVPKAGAELHRPRYVWELFARESKRIPGATAKRNGESKSREASTVRDRSNISKSSWSIWWWGRWSWRWLNRVHRSSRGEKLHACSFAQRCVNDRDRHASEQLSLEPPAMALLPCVVHRKCNLRSRYHQPTTIARVSRDHVNVHDRHYRKAGQGRQCSPKVRWIQRWEHYRGCELFRDRWTAWWIRRWCWSKVRRGILHW